MNDCRQIPHALTGKRRVIFVKLCAIALVQVCLAAATAFLVRSIFDSMGRNAEGWSAATLGNLGMLALIAIAMAWCKFAERTSAEVLGQRYVHTLRLQLFDHLSAQPLQQLQSGTRGGHLLRFIGDLNAIRQWISLGLARLSVASLMTVGSLAALSVINFRLAGTVAAAIVLGGSVSLLLGNKMREAARLARRHRVRLASDLNERIALMPVVQAFSQISRERRRVARRGRTLRDAMIARARIVGSLRGVSELITGLAVVAILAVGGLEVSNGRTSAGSLLAAMAILGMLTPALRDLSRSLEYWHTYKISVGRIEAFLATPILDNTEQLDLVELSAGPGTIEFHAVHADTRLQGITATAEAGSTITVVGPNGGGKSTLLSLVSRFLEPTSGRVLIDGQNISTCTIRSLRTAVGMVSADLPLMRGTIKRNICYRHPNASHTELERVCNLCGITDMLADFPDGLNTRVYEGGTNLSLGQRQRIALARSLIGQPRILLLDEADANLDPSSMELVDRVLKSFAGTVMVVSHRVERIMRAHQIWHVAEGEIVEVGNASDLLSLNGPTFRLLSEVIWPLPHPAGQHSKQMGKGRALPVQATSPELPGPLIRKHRLDRVQVLTSSLEPRCSYLLYVPESTDKNMPILVTVHGISCNAEEHVDAFAEFADQFGFIVVAPVFTAVDFAGYQRFGYSKEKKGQRSDFALHSIMHDVAERTQCETQKFYLFGYSGGGQFAHRYAMAYPNKVISAAFGAPGWFSFPDKRARFPRGLREAHSALELDFQPENFLRVPMTVIVGENDTQRDPALNTSPRIDAQQGKTRFERGQRWLQVMRNNARNCGFDTQFEFHSLQASGHDFEQCVNQGQMIEHVLKFFRLGTLASLPQKNIAAPMDGQQPTHHVVVIKQDVA